MKPAVPAGLLACFAMTAAIAAPPPAPETSIPYRSVFTDYTPYREKPMPDWRAANDEMGRLGGHMGQMGRMGGPMQGMAMPGGQADEAMTGMHGHQHHHMGGQP